MNDNTEPKVTATLAGTGANTISVKLDIPIDICAELSTPHELVAGTLDEDAWLDAGHALADAVRAVFLELAATVAERKLAGRSGTRPRVDT